MALIDFEIAAEDAPPTPTLGSLYDDALRAALAAALRREGAGVLEGTDEAHLNALGRRCATEFRSLSLEVRAEEQGSSKFGGEEFRHGTRSRNGLKLLCAECDIHCACMPQNTCARPER